MIANWHQVIRDVDQLFGYLVDPVMGHKAQDDLKDENTRSQSKNLNGDRQVLKKGFHGESPAENNDNISRGEALRQVIIIHLLRGQNS